MSEVPLYGYGYTSQLLAADRTTPESRKWWIVFRPPVGAVLTFENKSLAQRIDV